MENRRTKTCVSAQVLQSVDTAYDRPLGPPAAELTAAATWALYLLFASRVQPAQLQLPDWTNRLDLLWKDF